tara:strand:+ start:2068 stop:2832 length:765 start_codon:yes stop_codon:yes gene_type:complete
MKVIILAGGYGTRLSEYTENIPKPMVKVGGKPIIWHIMQHYANYGYNDFYIALGYKAEKVKEYFLSFNALNADFSIDLNNGNILTHEKNNLDWKINLIDTGQDSMTGGRVKRMEPFIGNEPFMLTYGDGLSDIDLNELVKFHKKNGKMVTVTAVHPVARFGELNLNGNSVVSFKEKPQLDEGWINGGFFVCQPEFFSYIKNDNTILEREPLEKIANNNELVAFRHNGFWQCMDSKRDRDLLENLWKKDKAPWKK